MNGLNWGSLLDVYIYLAMGYNVVSLLMKDVTNRPLAPTDPAFGVLMMAAVYLWFTLAPQISLNLYLFVSAVFIYMICRFGIYQHAVNFKVDAYHSRLSWLVAIIINVFGVTVLGGNIHASI